MSHFDPAHFAETTHFDPAHFHFNGVGPPEPPPDLLEANPARLIPFIVNSRDAQVIEMGESDGVGYMRFFENGQCVCIGNVPVEIVSPYLSVELPDVYYVQSGKVMSFAHPDHPPYELTRVSIATWTMLPVVFGATILPPATLFCTSYLPITVSTIISTAKYVVTAIGADGEESLASASISSDSPGDTTSAVYLAWTPSVGAESYRIYRQPGDVGGATGAYGFIGVAGALEASFNFIDNDETLADYAQQPPIEKIVFNSVDNYPAVVGYWQQRRCYANTNNEPDKFWASQTGRHKNFNISVPLADDDAVTFRLVSETTDEIRHILGLTKLVLLSEGAEWLIEGDAQGVLTPIAINSHKASSNGAGVARPVQADNRLLFLQAMGTAIRDLKSTIQIGLDAFDGRDLTLFSTHLFDGFNLVEMAWQAEYPHIAWIVRDDGLLLALTYIPDQEVVAWSRHDTDGLFESVASIPENGEMRVYVIVNREVAGERSRLVERFASPFLKPMVEEAWFVDSAVEYDGRETQTPVTVVTGLDHLEGRDVAIYAWGKRVTLTTFEDIGYVLANPLNSELAIVTVAGGLVNLGAEYLVARVGLPYMGDVETLDIDTASGATVKTTKQIVNTVGMQIIQSRNLWAGGEPPPAEDLTDPDTLVDGLDRLALSTDTDYNDLQSDFVKIHTQRGMWNTNGRVFMRSLDPTPFELLAAVPIGYVPQV